jgi:hypothetical protein
VKDEDDAPQTVEDGNPATSAAPPPYEKKVPLFLQQQQLADAIRLGLARTDSHKSPLHGFLDAQEKRYTVSTHKGKLSRSSVVQGDLNGYTLE